MLKGVVIAAAALAGVVLVPANARADACGDATSKPFWVEYAGHDAPVPAKGGLTLAVSSGTVVPAQMRAQGARTVFFDLNFNNRVGTTVQPADPATIPDRANRLFDFAVSVTGCGTPIIALNELFGAQTQTPWSDTNARYRANVLALLQGLAARGARVYLTIANPPYTGGEAADWWREAAKSAVLVRQVYFTSPNVNGLYKRGPAGASRSMRSSLRTLVRKFTDIGIPANRVALELQFQSVLGQGGREGLQPKSAWMEIVKLEALAVRQVTTELGTDSIWSWGWATFSEEGQDPDKPDAVCVYLWARDPGLCDGVKAGGPGFDASLTEGQLLLPAGAQCVLSDGTAIRLTALAALQRLTGDRDVAYSALLERAALASLPIPTSVVAAAARGTRGRTAAVRAILQDDVRRAWIRERLSVGGVSRTAVAAFQATYAETRARLVRVSEPVSWLGGRTRGYALEATAPPELFSLARPGLLHTPDGLLTVTPLEDTLPLGALPPELARPSIVAALHAFAQADAYRRWLARAEGPLIDDAVCARDDLPFQGEVDLAPYVPRR
jgi:hypothetical protein